MPCATIHLLLADRALETWCRHPASAPLEAARPEIRAAFIHGALAPDMGFIPGVDRFVSELAHYVRPAALARAVKHLAETPLDEAFAWGWATHLLGDIEIHPIVGRAVGERLYGDRERRVDAGEDVATHVSSEVGLDIAFLAGNPEVSKPPDQPHFNRSRIRHFASALTRASGIPWDATALLCGHRTAVRLSRYWPGALTALSLGRPTLAPEEPVGLSRRLATAARMDDAGSQAGDRGVPRPMLGCGEERIRSDPGPKPGDRPARGGETGPPGFGHGRPEARRTRSPALVVLVSVP